MVAFVSGGRSISEGFILAVFEAADRNSGDVQELYDSIWCTSEAGEKLDAGSIRKGLMDVFTKELRRYEDDCARLTKFQFKAMVAVAKWGGTKFFSSESLARAEMPSPATAKRALDRLVAAKILFLRKDEYRFFNPFFQQWIVYKNF